MTSARSARRVWLPGAPFVLVSLLSIACVEQDEARGLPAPSAEAFARDVYPILLRDCGFPACHGDAGRFFQVYGPGRTRLSPDTAPYAPASEAERLRTLERARSMLVSPAASAGPPLLKKPLAESAGGAGHEGDDAWGQAVYRTPSDPSYRVLEGWADGAADAEQP